MGLRINTNLPSLIALNHLRIADERQQKSMERVSTGLRINRASDDPAGLALSESMRAEIRALHKASENADHAGNLISTADAAITQIGDLLVKIRASAIFALNSTAGPSQLSAEQDSLESMIDSVRRISKTTRFGGIPLLDGEASFQTESVDPTELRDIRPTRVRFNPVTDVTAFSGEIASAAQQAMFVASGVTGGNITLEVRGPQGSMTLGLPDGTTASGVAAAIDSVRGFTGIYASGATILTEQYGSAEGYPEARPGRDHDRGDTRSRDRGDRDPIRAHRSPGVIHIAYQ